ncbi:MULTISPECIES: PaaI family thioesterase [Nocardiopsis]|uniref:Acyl-coenzyme A thioesterase THEM4 n=1 Tax=Nocardiopsis sinuspersici TaxID=501010 RepID=A0A1V3BX90_9ACTN|nr:MULTISPECIES: PaaI family thioesterase [Nocardiopsis]NYH54373.1 acyl-coenzyme A thioesterase PaaI-like protein [Nocardiopsis sinuspersici]OOC53174.1 thioesterase [Nocardiopsis sinuspersici]
MTVNTQSVAERPDPRAFGLPVVEQAQIPAELRSLVARVHDLIDAVANTEADADTLAEAASTVEGLTDGLNVARRQIGTMVQRDLQSGDTEFGTITNIVAGDTNPAAPPLLLERTPEGLRGEVTLNTVYQGPPGLVHGGWIAALLDQAVGSVSAVETAPGLTANLNVDYRRPTPLFTPLEVTSWVERVEGRKVFVAGRIRAHGEVTAEATALMIQVSVPGTQEG